MRQQFQLALSCEFAAGKAVSVLERGYNLERLALAVESHIRMLARQ